MKKQILILIVLAYSSCSTAVRKPAKTEFEVAANYVCKLAQEKPLFVYSEKFHKSFREAVPHGAVVGIFAGIFKDYGACENIETFSKDGLNGYFFTLHKGVKLHFTMNLTKEDSLQKIAGLMYKGKFVPPVKIKNYQDLSKLLSKKKGKFTFLFKKINGPSEFEFKSDDRHALGSVFKLYILAALLKEVEAKKLSWSKKFPIKDELKSLPSGKMQNLKEGTLVDVLEYASKMISISDNTGTDHLLNIVGRGNVESLLQEGGLNSFIKDNRPFLSTLEMFKTRGFWSQKQVDEYLIASREARAELINEIPFVSRKDLLKRLEKWYLPKYNEEIEWFANSKDICRLYEWMDTKKDKNLRKVLGLNTPFINIKKSKRWSYAGYKGGSEPGVLEMAYLLEDNKGERYCLYIGQNHGKKEINQEQFFSLVEGFFNFLEK